MEDKFHLYFHSPCFDGIVSALLVLDYFETTQGISAADLIPVNYDLRSSWLSTSLRPRAVIVDFLYHHESCFWADHHQTTFLNKETELHYQNREGPFFVYDSSAGSCAGLLWRHLMDRLSYRNEHYESLVQWAEKIDAARYDSVEEAVLGTDPALQLRSSLALDDGREYSIRLVRALRDNKLDQVTQLPFVQRRIKKAQRLLQAGLDRFSKTCRLVNQDIVVFDVDTNEVLINRYAPYFFFPNARYSIGILRTEDEAKITAMRNPWWEFASLPLGRIFEKFGGGGHQRVGSLLLSHGHSQDATQIMKRLLHEMSDAPTMESVLK